MPSADDLVPYLRKIDEARIYSNFGPLHRNLVDRLSDYFSVNSNQIVLMSNATLALQASIELLSEAGSEVSLPAWTFTATAAAVVSAGMKPKFLDIDENWRPVNNIDTSLFLDVLPFGTGLRDPDRSKFRKVIDGAASFDALKGCGLVLDNKEILVISMHSTKLIGAGEGAICIVKDEDWAASLKSWSNFGFKPNSRVSNSSGTNSKLSEYAAAVALASLDRWPETREKLRLNRAKAIEITNQFNFRLAPPMRNEFITPYWVVDFDSEFQKEHAVRVLHEMEIESREWWAKGCHRMPAYSQYVSGDLPQTDNAAATSLGLPFHGFMIDQDFERLEKAFRKI